MTQSARFQSFRITWQLWCMRRASLFLLLYTTAVISSHAQPGILQGKVVDSLSHESLPGVTVGLNTGKGTITNDNGLYSLPLKPDSYTITFSYLGYVKKILPVRINESDTVTLNIALVQSSTELNLVVVTASKYEKDIRRETVSMEVLKSDFITNTNCIEMNEAIEKVPGLNIIDNQANVRGGSGFSYGAGSRVLVLVDGIPELTGDANDVKWEFLPVENLDQVEIIKGASSVLYGSSALNGVINLRTRYPVSTPETRITAYSGLWQNPSDKSKAWWGNQQPFFNGGNFFHSRKFGRFDLVMGGNLYNEHSFHEGEYAERGRINANTRYRFKHIDGLAAGLNVNYMYYQSGTYFLWADDTTGAYRAFGGLDSATTTVAQGKNTRMTVDPFVTWFTHNGAHHDLHFRYFYTKNNNDTHQSSTSNYYYGEYQFQKKFIFDMNWVIGASGSYSDVNAQLYGDHFANNLAAYTQLDKTFGNLTAVAGVRFETFRVDTASGNSEPVVRAGLNYQCGKETFLRASFGQGYRFPSIAEKFVNTSISALKVFPNPEVQPERGWSAEIGIKRGFKISEWVGYLDLAGFVQKYHDLIEFKFGYYDPKPTPGEINPNYLGFKSVNIENAQISGLELSAVGQGSLFGINTNLLGGITYISPIDLDQKKFVDSLLSANDQFTNQQQDSLKLTKILNYRYKVTFKINIDQSLKKFSWGAEVRYNSFMINVDPFFLGTDPLIVSTFQRPVELIPGVKEWRDAHHHGDVVVDAHIAYNIRENIRIAFIAKNLLNHEYSIRPALLEAPRNFTLQVSVRI